MSSGASFNIGIQAIAYRLGSRAETGADLVRDNPDWRIEDIEAKSGVITRHIAAPGETASDMAASAALELFERGVGRAEIDALIFVTQSPDYYLPTTACLLQDRLDLPRSCLAFDINQGCSGFVYGLGVSTSLINAGLAESVLLLCGDTYTRYIKDDDRSCRPIFSDGAAATLIGRSTEAAVGPFVFGSDGSGGQNLIVRGGGARDAGLEAGGPNPHLYMNGPKIFMFTMSAVPKLVVSLLDASETRLEEVDLFVFHQASALVLENIARQLKLPPGKLYSNLSRTGNTVSATIPIALAEASREGKVQPGKTVLLCGFGVGYSWAGALLKWGALKA
jgi:3-oxoacyl-[acyl-carrier-protein] synthase-3